MGNITAGIYFATYGHWCLALQQAGYRVLWQVQPDIRNPKYLDRFASKVLYTNFPNIPVYTPNKFNDKVDIIVGSPPCIGFSQGNPSSGPDHWANRNFIKCFEKIEELQPKYFLIEIVPRILKIGQTTYKEALSKVEDYNINPHIFEISEYGVPAKRKRLYLFGSKEYLVNLLGTLPKRNLMPCSKILDKYAYSPQPDGKNLLSILKKDGTPKKGPFNNALRKSRILDRNKPVFTITGMAFTDMRHPSGQRFLTIQEIADLMGFPAGYKYCTTSIGTKCRIIASGVDIRFTKLLLEHLRRNIIER